MLKTFLLDLRASCSQLMLNTTIWYREQNPEAAQEEDLYETFSIPLHVKSYTGNRHILLCPACSSNLNGDDITFNGYFCEKCRTRWIYEGVTT